MNKSNLTGWKDVYKFTITQTLKSKAFIISYIILLGFMLVSMPAINLFTSSGSSDNSSRNPINKVYVDNKTALPDMDFSDALKDPKLSHIAFETMSEDYAAVSARIKANEKESVILTIGENQNNYSLSFLRASDGPVKEKSLQPLANYIVGKFDAFKISTMGIKAEQLTIINAGVATKVSMADEKGNVVIKENTSISNGEYWFIYATLFIVMMINILASTQIAYSILTEKSTRVIEYLLISVRPLALMVGKIFAMLTVVLFQVISMIIALFISNKISGLLSPGNGPSVLSQYFSKDVFQNLSMTNILLCLILFALGMIFYGTLAGIAGASVSRLEELSEGLSLFTILNIVGAYMGMGAASVLMMAGMNGYVVFSFLFPLSSAFLMPGAVLVGKVSPLIAAAAILLQTILIVLLFKFVSNIFETLILHNGNRIKLKELLRLSRAA